MDGLLLSADLNLLILVSEFRMLDGMSHELECLGGLVAVEWDRRLGLAVLVNGRINQYQRGTRDSHVACCDGLWGDA